MKRSKIILGLIAGLLVTAYSSALWIQGVENVNAATRLYGVQQVIENITEDDPFVILELVPDKAYASFGSYVLGKEPNVDSRLLADCNDSAARRAKVLALFDGLVAERDAGGIGTTYPLFYDYNTVYREQVSAPDDLTGWKVLEFAPTVNEDGTVDYYTEDRIGYYEEVGEGGDYTATLVESEEPSDDSVSDNDAADGEEGNQGADGTVSGGDAESTAVYTYSYTPGQGTYKWVDANTDDALMYPVSFEKLYYKVTLTSNDWFAKSVFEYDEDFAAGNIEVIPITPNELETNVAKGYLAEYEGKKIQGWNGVDMLYISNSTCMNLTAEEKALFDSYTKTEAMGTDTAVKYTNDISTQTAYNIYEYVLNTSIPVIVDSSIVSEVAASATPTPDTNLQKLAFLLWDYTTETTPTSYAKTDGSTIDVSSWTTEWPAGLTDILLANTAAKAFGTYGSIQGSVYFNSQPGMVSVGFANFFASVEFDDLSSGAAYTDAENSLTGISAVVNEIDTENFYNELNGVEYTTEYNTTTEQVEISQSSVIKYILNFAYRRAIVYKDTITVLDIEPTRYSTLTADKIRGWLKEADAERIKKIEIVQMTTAEFVGVLSDLNAEYDLIYIGDCIGPKEKNGSMNQNNGATVYNDTTMNGLIYAHTGDTYEAPEKFKGLLDTEYISAKTELTGGNLTTRFSGNDITKEKMEELKDFVNSGYPVVVADKFYTTNTAGGKIINSGYVDNASYLYEFLDYYTTKAPKENVMSDNLNDSGLLATYINMSKLYLSIISAPLEYAVTYNNSGYIDTVQYLKKVNGKYTLEYVFELADNSEARLDSVAYEVEIFIDSNADGRYDATEELDGLIVREYDTGDEIPYNQLVTGLRYIVTRELPDGYVGMIPWKLEVTQRLKNETAAASNVANAPIAVHTSAKGYTAVPAEEVTNIRIIQIKSEDSGGLDLSTNGTFQNLFQNVNDKMKYNVNITPVTAEDYVTDYNDYISNNSLTDGTVEAYTSFYNSYFSTYDMIMIGFVDMFDDISSDGATMALKLFIESGRSVLFSHDTTSFVNASRSVYNKTAYDYWGYYLNQNIRSIVGMDRYGVTEDSLNFLKNGADLLLTDPDASTPNAYRTAIEALNKDIAYTMGSEKAKSEYEVHGYSNGNLVMQGLNVQQYDDVYYTNASSRVTSISQVNKGQITSFPFDINIDDSYEQNVETTTVSGVSYQMIDLATMTVKTTHSQYYQLDLNLDKTADQESDIVVWYCLADGMYDAVPNDVRNNYYIYSVGNVMYTGMGHSGNSVSLDEAKLFVNTMIASFNAGKKDPTVAIIQNADNKGAIKQYSYRTYDAEFGMADQENEVIHFYVTDNNIISGTKSIALKYYVEIPQSSYSETNASHTTTTVGGETVYLRELTTDEVVSSVSTIENNAVGTITLKADLFATAFADPEIGSVRIFISAQTTLDYDSAKADETTGVVFTNITVKARELFYLD